MSQAQIYDTMTKWMNERLKENKNIDIDTLSTKSHDEAWENAWEKQKAHPMDAILMAKAGGANESMIEYIKENEEINKLAF